MATIRINLNQQVVAFNCFVAGADVCPDIRIDHNAWPDYVIVENVDNYDAWQAVMLDVFAQCGADTNAIIFETI
jgi:hypothetical protein